MNTPTQKDLLDWAIETFGDVAKNIDERAARLVEEAIEIAQAGGVSLATIEKITKHVYSRPAGEIGQEIGGVAFTLATFAERTGFSVSAELQKEWERVHSLPKEHWQAKHQAKVAAGTADLSPALSMRTEFAEQYRIPCVLIVSVELKNSLSAQQVIDRCKFDDAWLRDPADDEILYCVQFPERPQELYTESAIRRSL